MDKGHMKQLIEKPEYDFLRQSEHLGDNILFLTLGGSRAYGTDVKGSDVDIRGVAHNSKTDLLGLTNFETFTDIKTDTVVYSFQKLMGLLLNCNPNTIEMLGGRPDSYILVSDAGQMLLANKELFLSRRAVHSFGGYANAQLRRLECALAKDRVDDRRKEAFALCSVASALKDFELKNGALPEGGVHLYIGAGKTEGMGTEILVDAHLQGYPLRDFKAMMSALGTTIGQYSTLGKRNTKKDDAHLDKHAMHLIRLYLMCLDILEKGEINTYRENDREMLLEIRNGKYRLPDGTYDPAFFELVDSYEKRMKYAAENTALPDTPDFNKTQELAVAINEMGLQKERKRSEQAR